MREILRRLAAKVRGALSRRRMLNRLNDVYVGGMDPAEKRVLSGIKRKTGRTPERW
jgi:hypothetical protein